MISIVVMAHPKRATAARRLQAQVGAHIIWDHHQDEWDTGARALAAHGPSAEWHCVIQDDALPVPNFGAALIEATQWASRTLISLYTGTTRPKAARVTEALSRAGNAAWLTHPTLLWGVGILIPTEHIPPLLEWAQDDERPYDQRIGHWYRLNRLPVYYTNPSLVDHQDDTSLLNHDKHGQRRAHRLGIPAWNHQTAAI